MSTTLSDRISQAMTAAGVTPGELAAYCGVRVQAVYQWRSGATKTLDGTNLVKAATKLGVRSLWLGEGKGPMRHEASEANTEEGPAIRGEVPEISWVQAGDATLIVDNYQPGHGDIGHLRGLPYPPRHASGRRSTLHD